jgi:hypothetical protein
VGELSSGEVADTFADWIVLGGRMDFDVARAVEIIGMAIFHVLLVHGVFDELLAEGAGNHAQTFRARMEIICRAVMRREYTF